MLSILSRGPFAHERPLAALVWEIVWESFAHENLQALVWRPFPFPFVRECPWALVWRWFQCSLHRSVLGHWFGGRSVFFVQERPWALVWKSFVLLVRFLCRVSVPFGHERLPILFLHVFTVVSVFFAQERPGARVRRSFPCPWGHERAPALVWRSLYFRL